MINPHALPGDWRGQLDMVVDTMREISRQHDPQEMIRIYGQRFASINPVDGFLSVTRRGLPFPAYRIARSSTWSSQPNPWTERAKLPVLEGGLLGTMIYSNRPHIIDELDVAPDDPGAEYFAGMRSLVCIPVFDDGEALNAVVQLRRQPAAFLKEQLPQMVWMTNLVGRATHNLVLSQELREAHDRLDQEMKVVGDIQRSLLPAELPEIETMDLAVHYRASQRAGGDYYDVFPLSGGRYGLLIADVSGHGTPAAVLMAITHAIAHLHDGPSVRPGELLEHLNEQLTARYANAGQFVTAFYGIYDPATRELRHANAGHPPPRLKHCDDGSVECVESPRRIPLGIFRGQDYPEGAVRLRPGDQLILYTDGVTETRNVDDQLFGSARLDRVLDTCHLDADGLTVTIIEALDRFASGVQPADDRTLVVARIR